MSAELPYRASGTRDALGSSFPSTQPIPVQRRELFVPGGSARTWMCPRGVFVVRYRAAAWIRSIQEKFAS